MLGPLAAILMGVVMVVLAARNNDGLVVEDYYKRGLAINQTLDRENRARELGIAGALVFNPEHTVVRLTLRGADPGGLSLRFVHPTRAGMDQTVALRRIAPGLYEGALAPVVDGRWHLLLEEGDAGGWRISGSWRPGEPNAVLESVQTAR
jgi:hypothetical protein